MSALVYYIHFYLRNPRSLSRLSRAGCLVPGVRSKDGQDDSVPHPPPPGPRHPRRQRQEDRADPRRPRTRWTLPHA